MTILLRKLKREAVALIRQDGRLFRVATPRHPSLLATVGVFALAILLPLLALAITAYALHHGLGDAGLALAVAPIVQLRADRDRLVKKANAALETAQATAKKENRQLTAEELKAQDDFDAEIKAIDDQIALEQRKLDRERNAPQARGNENGVPGSGPQRESRITNIRDRSATDPTRGFSSPREFLMSVMENAGLRDRADVADERLRPLAVFDKEDRQAGGELAFVTPLAFTPGSVVHAAVGSDEQSSSSDPYGGALVPRSFIPRLLSIGTDADPTIGRTQDLPMQTPIVEIPARTDKNHSSSVTGGFTFSRRAETAAATASRMQMEKVTMKAASLFGLAYATEEILTDSPISFAAIIESGFRDQLPAHLLNEKINGLGDSEFLGVKNSDATISVSKENAQTAATIVHANVVKMRARCWGYGNAIWMANHDCYPQLASLSVVIGTSGALVYQQSVQEDRPDMLLGRPIFYTEFCNTVGTVGDLILGNWSQYLEGIYQPLQTAESMHVRFVNHERAFKTWLRNAGSPWWRSALTPKNGSTLSPFVTLATRA